MKRILLLIPLFFATILCYSQVSVAGVSLKDEYSKVERVLESRYGVTYLKEYNSIKYTDFTIGGIFFEWATFEFVYRPATQDRRLNNVILSSHFKVSELEEAKKTRDRIANLYGSKYNDIESITLESGLKAYRCAYNPYMEMYMILITLEKTRSKGGETFYYVDVSYGPGYGATTDDI